LGFIYTLNIKKEKYMKNKKTLLALLASTILTSTAMSNELGSGYYAQDCAHPGGGYNIVIYKDGTAMIESDPDVYEHLETSYSFFGNSTPSDFLVAILFDAKNSPLPPYKGRTGWLEIWKADNSFLLLENGRASKELKLCTRK
jgi:hypothetical protein